MLFLAASLSSTVGFAFSAIAAAMIFHLVPDNVEAVQIMLHAFRNLSDGQFHRLVSVALIASGIALALK